jgi:hypothetical protein
MDVSQASHCSVWGRWTRIAPLTKVPEDPDDQYLGRFGCTDSRYNHPSRLLCREPFSGASPTFAMQRTISAELTLHTSFDDTSIHPVSHYLRALPAERDVRVHGAGADVKGVDTICRRYQFWRHTLYTCKAITGETPDRRSGAARHPRCRFPMI